MKVNDKKRKIKDLGKQKPEVEKLNKRKKGAAIKAISYQKTSSIVQMNDEFLKP